MTVKHFLGRRLACMCSEVVPCFWMTLGCLVWWKLKLTVNSKESLQIEHMGRETPVKFIELG